MIHLTHVPDGIEAIREFYGDPRDPDFIQRIETVTLAAPVISTTGVPLTALALHREVARSADDSLRLLHRFLTPEQWRTIVLGVGYQPLRMKENRSEYHIDAWGIGVTINPHLAPFRAANPLQPELILGIFAERGWRWAAHNHGLAQAAVGY
ncbi:MAG: hypothetical protein OXC31_05140 [Spirochaetaceae bacterium]|nr:hypothetical protein [Spirochaetaceae bacterium]